MGSMNKLFKLFVFTGLFFSSNKNLAQTNSVGLNPITIYLQYVESEPLAAKDIMITSDIYFPYYEFKRYIIDLKDFRKNGYIKFEVYSLIFKIEKQVVFVSPNDTVEFTFKNGNLILVGENERYRNFGEYKKNEFDSKNINPSKLQNQQSFTEYKSYCINYYDEERKYIENYFLNKDQILKQFLLNRSKYSLIVSLYNGAKQMVVNKKSISYDFIKSIDTSVFNHPDLYLDYFYGAAVDDYNSFINENYSDSISPSTYFKLVYSAKKIFSSPVYEYLLMKYIRRISRWGTPFYKDIMFFIYSELKNKQWDSATNNKIEKSYSDFKMLLKNLNEFSSIRLKTGDNKVIKLGNIIEYGKYTFIDFWASWCGACIPELPFISSHQKKYCQIKFITLSIDENEKAWKKAFLKFHQSKLNSFLIIDGLKSRISIDYDIQAIPRFLFFDKTGKCISASDIRPSDPVFISYLEQLMKLN